LCAFHAAKVGIKKNIKAFLSMLRLENDYWGNGFSKVCFQLFWTSKKYKGMPMVMFTGKVTARAMGRNSPGLALGTDIFMAAGTAI
jgi:hypothetical protein